MITTPEEIIGCPWNGKPVKIWILNYGTQVSIASLEALLPMLGLVILAIFDLLLKHNKKGVT